MPPRIPAKAAQIQRFGFLLIPNFSLIALSAAVDPLRLANIAQGRNLYQYKIIGLSADPVHSSDGIKVLPDQVIGESSHYDAVFVVGPNPIPKRGFTEVTRWLKFLATQGMTLGGIDTGTYFLAKAGLLNGYRCTIHWEDREPLLEQFPDLMVTHRLFEIDRNRYTCSGGVSPLDLMIFVLRHPPGSRDLAQQVSDLLMSHQRGQNETQALPIHYRYLNLPQVLQDALEIMENNVEEVLSPSEIADYLKTSRRHLERLFQAHLHTSPAKKYLEIRLAKARLSVLRTNRRIDDISINCGFASPAHFIARYKMAYGQSPLAERNAQARAEKNSF